MARCGTDNNESIGTCGEVSGGGRNIGTSRDTTGGEGLAYDLIFIDGGHLFEQALTDFFLYAPLCKIGGLVVLDDMWMSSIKTVASFVRTNRNDFSEIPTAIPNLCVFRKIGKDEREWHYFRPFVADQEQGKIAEQA